MFAQFLFTEFVQALALAADSGKPVHVAESEVIGADHAYVGALLAKKWQFGAALVDCIRDHHALDVEPTSMLDCLRMADAICRKHAFGDSGNPWRDEELAQLPTRFGVDLDAVVAALGDLNKHVEDARAFAKIGTEG